VAFKIWTGVEPNIEVMKDAIINIIGGGKWSI
jgi:shikimate 5-dehydrogenase